MAYLDVVGKPMVLTANYRAIIRVLKENPYGLTDYEIAIKNGYADPNKFRPRRNELEKGGFVFEAGKRPCNITGKTAIIWKLTQNGEKNATF
jgi:hypothetical protein